MTAPEGAAARSPAVRPLYPMGMSKLGGIRPDALGVNYLNCLAGGLLSRRSARVGMDLCCSKPAPGWAEARMYEIFDLGWYTVCAVRLSGVADRQVEGRTPVCARSSKELVFTAPLLSYPRGAGGLGR